MVGSKLPERKKCTKLPVCWLSNEWSKYVLSRGAEDKEMEDRCSNSLGICSRSAGSPSSRYAIESTNQMPKIRS